MERTIDAFHEDEVGDWVAELSCLHNQHLRHRPPFQERPWVVTSEGRAQRIGTAIDCPLCDRAELPDGLQVVRTAGPFTTQALPTGLRREHRIADRTWGLLRVLEGSARFTMHVQPPLERLLRPGDSQAIPPGVLHGVQLDERGEIAVDFLVRSR